MSNVPYKRLNKDDAVVLLVDHQTGLISLVQDFSPNEFKNNVLALAACGKYFKLPTILTTSFEEGPNGPLVPELKQLFPDAPFIARPGQINAWDNEDFAAAVRPQHDVVSCRLFSLPGLPQVVADYHFHVVEGRFDCLHLHAYGLGTVGHGLRHIGATVVFTGARRTDGHRGRLCFPQPGHFLRPISSFRMAMSFQG